MRILAFCLALLCGSALAMDRPPCNATVYDLTLQATKTQAAPVVVWNMAGAGAVWACKVGGAWQPFHAYATWAWLAGRPADEASRALRRFAAKPDAFWSSVQGKPCEWHVKQSSFTSEAAICRDILAAQAALLETLR